MPRLAHRLRADAIYSHRECGPLWGPALVLHMPEDPEVRWARTPPVSLRQTARRVYSRALLRRSLQSAEVVGASTPAVARRLAERYGLLNAHVSLIPLGVDLELFTPAPSPTRDAVFHLGSADPRDRTELVVDGWIAASAADSTLPPLVIGGSLGQIGTRARQHAQSLGVDVRFTGRLDDSSLACWFREAAVVVQPSADEGFGLQPLEAMASGAPLVVTQDGAVADVVADAAIVVGATPGDIAHGIRVALSQGNTLRRAARQRAEGYSWDSTANAVLHALEAARAGREKRR